MIGEHLLDLRKHCAELHSFCSEATVDKLYNMGSPGWVIVEAGDERALLDGDFTADELEAIVVWMRDPAKVINCV